jgi:hypothetical protein
MLDEEQRFRLLHHFKIGNRMLRSETADVVLPAQRGLPEARLAWRWLSLSWSGWG